jgi:hypothetical protein
MHKDHKFRAIPGWMCKVDFDFELGEASGGNKVYASEEDLKRHAACVSECGMAEVVVMSAEDFRALSLAANITSDDIYSSNLDLVIWEKHKTEENQS